VGRGRKGKRENQLTKRGENFAGDPVPVGKNTRFILGILEVIWKKRTKKKWLICLEASKEKKLQI